MIFARKSLSYRRNSAAIAFVLALLAGAALGQTRKALVTSDGKITWITAANWDQFDSSDQPAFSDFTAAAIRWTIVYEDIQQNTGSGFADNQLGELRRQALVDTLEHVGETLGATPASNIRVLVRRSLNEPGGSIAVGGTFYRPTPVGFHRGFMGDHIQTGVDPDPSGDDMTVTVNFGHPLYAGTGRPPATQYDLRSVLLHEITHALGILSLLDASGRSRTSNTNPGVFTTWDKFLYRYTNVTSFRALFNEGQRKYIGVAGDLTGQMVRWKGFYPSQILIDNPQIYTPTAFKLGSSLSHFDPRYSLSAVMTPEGTKGVRLRRIQHFEAAVLRELGYANARAFGESLYAFAKPKTHPLTTNAHAVAGLAMYLDGDGNLDQISLIQEATESVLIVNGRRVKLGRKYLSLSESTVGPNKIRGLLLEAADGGEVLALGAYRPSSSETLKSNFEYRHSAYTTRSRSAGLVRKSNRVAIGNFDGRSDLDVVTILPSASPGGTGVVSYLDEDGFLDGYARGSKLIDLAGAHLVYDLAAEPNLSGLFISHTNSLSHPPGSIAWIKADTGSRLTDLKPSTSTNVINGLSIGVSYSRMYGVRLPSSGTGHEIIQVNSDGNPTYRILSSFRMPGTVSDIVHHQDRQTGIESTFFIDDLNHRIMKMGSTFGNYSAWAGGGRGYEDAVATNARFDSPKAVCVGAGSLWVLDSGNKLIRRIELGTRTVWTHAGVAGTAGETDGEQGQATFNLEGWSNCWVVGDSLYVVDSAGGTGAKIRKISVNDGYTTTVSPSFSGELFAPVGFKGLGGKIYWVQGDFSAKAVHVLDLEPPYTRIGSLDAIKVANLNNDNCDDLVGVWRGVISTLISKCDGTFALVHQPNVSGLKAVDFGVGDINRDGKTDVLITGSARFEVYHGDGAGRLNFAANRGFLVDREVMALELRDFNHDDRIDIATIDQATEFKVYLQNELGWNNGDGSVGEAFSLFLGYADPPKWFAFEDVNNDSILDAHFGFETGKPTVLFLGKRP